MSSDSLIGNTNKPIQHIVFAGAVGRVNPIPKVVPLHELLALNSLLQVYGVLSVCTVATTYYNTRTWHCEEIKSSVACFSPIKLHKPTIAIDRLSAHVHTTCQFDQSRSK